MKEKGSYCFRIRVPKNLVKKLKYREIKKSLHTTNLQKAQNIAKFLHEYTDDLFKRVRSKMLSKDTAIISLYKTKSFTPTECMRKLAKDYDIVVSLK